MSKIIELQKREVNSVGGGVIKWSTTNTVCCVGMAAFGLGAYTTAYGLEVSIRARAKKLILIGTIAATALYVAAISTINEFAE